LGRANLVKIVSNKVY